MARTFIILELGRDGCTETPRQIYGGFEMGIRQVVVAWGLVIGLAVTCMQARAARLADGTAVRVRLTADLLSSRAKEGSRVTLEVAQPDLLQGVVVIPVGAEVWGAVQTVKMGKALYFDIEGVRLPNKQIVLLRCSQQKQTHSKKDVIKVETMMNGQLGAPQGFEFTAYLDQDVNVDVPGEPVAPAQPVPVAPPDPVVQPSEYVLVGFFSDPPGAEIRVDGELRDSTPRILKLLQGGHQIEFRLKGYKAQSQPLVLTPGTAVHAVRMTLEKEP